MASFDLFSLNRITFGLVCLALAVILLALLGLKRLKRWRTHRKKPDLSQHSDGSGYSGSRRSSPDKGLPYSGLERYRGRRRHRSTRMRPMLQPPSYKGRK